MTQLCRRPVAALLAAFSLMSAAAAEEPVRSLDPRLEVTLFAASPDIVQPICCTFDARGRLLVIESHTHFRPNDYKGPPKDRIRLLRDTNGDGKADEFITFFEGTTATMDVAAHPDGSIYVASRSEILRLRDEDGDGQAEDVQRVVFLDTQGNYPHDGLSGLSFDAHGDLWFGLGENLGVAYTVRGTAGPTVSGEGDGGSVFHCKADGTDLRRVATGFWNPFGATRDVYGNLFCIDNDPDASPPCRMLHIVDGGDYGYQFRYGRAGRHVFQSWNGQLWGTLPQLTGTGESPCAVHCYESDGLPDEYRGELLVAAWADHRIERYTLKPHGASYTAERKPFITGPADFRPVGIAVAPDGSLFISDWVLSNYNLHGRGAVWHVKPKTAPKLERPTDPKLGLLSKDRTTRVKAARELSKTPDGVKLLREQLTAASDVRVAAAALDALTIADQSDGFASLANSQAPAALRAMAVRLLVEQGESTASFLAESHGPQVVREAVFTPATDASTLAPRVVELLASDDPFLREAAVQRMSRDRSLRVAIAETPSPSAAVRRGLLLAERAAGESEAGAVTQFLLDPDEDVRFLAVKWISDDKLSDLRPQLAKMLADPQLNTRLYIACATALARLDGKPVNENELANFLFARLNAPAASSPTSPTSPASDAARVLALRSIPAKHPGMKLDFLGKLAAGSDEPLAVEAVRAIAEHPDANGRRQWLEKLMNDDATSAAARREAVASLASWAHELREPLMKLAVGDDARLSDEALRALVKVNLPNDDQEKLKAVAEKRPTSAPLVERLLGRPFFAARPAPADVDGWLKLAGRTGDAEAGRHVFTNAKLTNCSKCHRVDGRGGDVGPDLSTIGLQETRRNIESIVQPSAVVAPHYGVWSIETADGRQLQGMLVHTNLDATDYIDAKGDRFTVKTPDIVDATPVPTSIMPVGLPDQLTDQEFRDLVAYLMSRK